MLISFAEAMEPIAGLIAGGLLERVEGNPELRKVLVDPLRRKAYLRDQARNLLVWFIAGGSITPYWEDGRPISILTSPEARSAFHVFRADVVDEDSGLHEVRIPDADVYLDRETLELMTDVLGPSPTFYVRWQLAYLLAEMEPPWGGDFILLQSDEIPPLPQKVEDYFLILAPFTQSTGTPAPVTRHPLMPDGHIGGDKLFKLPTFQAFVRAQWPERVPGSWDHKKEAMVSGHKDGETVGTKDACPEPGNRLTIPKKIKRPNDALVVIRRAIVKLQEETKKDPTAPEVVAYLFGGRDTTGLVENIVKDQRKQDRVEKVILNNGKGLTRQEITRSFNRLMRLTDSGN